MLGRQRGLAGGSKFSEKASKALTEVGQWEFTGCLPA